MTATFENLTYEAICPTNLPQTNEPEEVCNNVKQVGVCITLDPTIVVEVQAEITVFVVWERCLKSPKGEPDSWSDWNSYEGNPVATGEE